MECCSLCVRILLLLAVSSSPGQKMRLVKVGMQSESALPGGVNNFSLTCSAPTPLCLHYLPVSSQKCLFSWGARVSIASTSSNAPAHVCITVAHRMCGVHWHRHTHTHTHAWCVRRIHTDYLRAYTCVTLSKCHDTRIVIDRASQPHPSQTYVHLNPTPPTHTSSPVSQNVAPEINLA